MKLAFHSIHGHGNHREERVVLRASDACELMRYILADSTYIDEKTMSNRLRHTHWFLNASLKKGDWVVLYTRSGQDSTSLQDGNTVYHRYWGLDRAVWNDSGDDAQLFELSDWTHQRVK